jgi:hypothetical protein
LWVQLNYKLQFPVNKQITADTRCCAKIKANEKKPFTTATLSKHLFLYLLTLVLSFQVWAQAGSNPNIDYTKNSADKNLRGSARVNPSTLAMELSIPLASYPGRNGNNMPVTLNYSSKVWLTKAIGTFRGRFITITQTKPVFGDRSANGWTSSLDVPQIDDNIEPELYATSGLPFADDRYFGGPTEPPDYPIYYIRRIRIWMPDGSSHEFRRDDGVHQHGTADHPSLPYEEKYNGTSCRLTGRGCGSISVM